MTWWHVGAFASVVISVASLSIAGLVARGLARTGQLRTDPLALATGVIFFSCGIGHGLHALHTLMTPHETQSGLAAGLRSAWTADMTLWDLFTAGVAVTYLALRSRLGQLLNTPQMFRDEVERGADRELGDVLRQLREGVIVIERDGRVKHVNPAARRMLDLLAIDADGEAPFRVVVSLVDITERRDALEVLRTSEVRHRTIVEALHDGVVLQAPDARIIACNRQAQRLLGLSQDQLMGRTSFDPRWRVLREDGTVWPGEEHPVPRALASGEPVGPETMGVHTPDDQLRWLEVFAMPIHEDGGRLVRPKAAEDALQKSEAQVRATLEGLTEGVVFYDENLDLVPIPARSTTPARSRTTCRDWAAGWPSTTSARASAPSTTSSTCRSTS